ncbi:MAG: nucleotidyltransferase family protein [Bacteroidetes bacterium]|nr:nucleotidyltransferase family protein [Bacteroidota bacterium]
MEQFAIIVLAAGPSSRLGEPKQLLPLADMNLLQHTVAEAIKVSKNVVVVLGAHQDLIKEKIRDLAAELIYNKDWEEGMASSIRCGLDHLITNKKPGAIIIMVADQPFVSSDLLNEIIAKYKESKKPIVACGYKQALGVPVLFDKIFFSELSALKGHSGAKKIILANLQSTESVSFPLGYIDIDTKEDYNQFKKIQSSN